jgi:hypothetical protein
MDMNTIKFYNNKVTKIQELEKNGKINEFLDEVNRLYPTMYKLFEKDTQFIVANQDIFIRFNNIKNHVAKNVIPKIESYTLGFTDIQIKINGITTNYPLHNPVKFMDVCLNLDNTNPYFFLMLSFLMIPLNYDSMQLCDKKV